MKKANFCAVPATVIASFALLNSDALAYGGGGGSSGCSDPKFFEAKPIGIVPALTEFSFVASNTDGPSLTVEVGDQKLQPTLVRRGNGDWDAKLVLAQPITQPGRVRVAINAKSSDGCAGFQAFFVEIKP